MFSVGNINLMRALHSVMTLINKHFPEPGCNFHFQRSLKSLKSWNGTEICSHFIQFYWDFMLFSSKHPLLLTSSDASCHLFGCYLQFLECLHTYLFSLEKCGQRSSSNSLKWENLNKLRGNGTACFYFFFFFGGWDFWMTILKLGWYAHDISPPVVI